MQYEWIIKNKNKTYYSDIFTGGVYDQIHLLMFAEQYKSLNYFDHVDIDKLCSVVQTVPTTRNGYSELILAVPAISKEQQMTVIQLSDDLQSGYRSWQAILQLGAAEHKHLAL